VTVAGLPIGGYSHASGDLFGQLLQRRLEYGATAGLCLLGMALVLARLFPSQRAAQARGEVAMRWISYSKASGFCLLLIGMGLSLTFLPEFFYLKDNFGVRINTIFKLYYQAWALWSVAAAYAIYSVLGASDGPRPHIGLRLVFGGICGLCLGLGLLYSGVGLYHRGWIETRQAYRPPSHWQDPQVQVKVGALVKAGDLLFSRVAPEEATASDLIRAHSAGRVAAIGEALFLQPTLTLDGAEGLLPADEQQALQCLQALVGRG